MLLSKHPLVLPLLLITAASPVASAVTAFETRDELKTAVDSYCQGTFDNASPYGSIENWDVSKITDMNGLFLNQSTCNPNVTSWDVSKVTNFGYMFGGAIYAFNQDISNWNVSNGTNFGYMFFQTHEFNQDISNWDVSSGTNFGSMFYDTNVFNQVISNWDVSSGTSFQDMFYAANAFDQPLLYCKWKSNNIFKNTTPNPCEGSKSCGWGQSECSTGTPPCYDNPEGWYDVDGPTYNCEWYGVGSNCAVYGDDYAREGTTANVACCACGGGNPEGPEASPSPTVSPPPTPGPPCYDNPEGWYDSDGPTYNCEWYGVGSNCAIYGDDYAREGTTANVACCACGGGYFDSFFY